MVKGGGSGAYETLDHHDTFDDMNLVSCMCIFQSMRRTRAKLWVALIVPTTLVSEWASRFFGLPDECSQLFAANT